MRTLSEIIDVVIESLKEGNKANWFNKGICGEIYNLEREGCFL